MITFKAQHICNTCIYKRDNNRNVHHPVSIFRLDPSNSDDMALLKNTAYDWSNAHLSNFAQYMYDETKDARFMPIKGYYNYEFYALTNKTRNFKELTTSDVLGLMEIENLSNKMIEIAYLQIEPKNTFSSKKRQFHLIGTTLIKSLINLYPQKDIIVHSIESAKNFYKKLGFIPQTNIKLFLNHSKK